MKHLALLLIPILSFVLTTQAQDPYIISGKIYDSSARAGLAAASIKVKGSAAGTVSADDGSFRLRTTQKLPLTLVVSSVGYKAQEFEVTQDGTQGLTLSLAAHTVLSDQVVVTASRVS